MIIIMIITIINNLRRVLAAVRAHAADVLEERRPRGLALRRPLQHLALRHRAYPLVQQALAGQLVVEEEDVLA